jgi:hypothetical protein
MISDQESISDHSIIKYAIKPGTDKWHEKNAPHTRYKTSKDSLINFQRKFLQIMKNKTGISCNDTREEDLDDTLCSLLTDETEIEKRIDELSEAITTACNKSASRSSPSYRNVPCWSADLTMLRKN